MGVITFRISLETPCIVIVKKVKMKIGNQEFDTRIAWCLEEDVPPLLGRIDVFNKFKIIKLEHVEFPSERDPNKRAAAYLLYAKK